MHHAPLSPSILHKSVAIIKLHTTHNTPHKSKHTVTNNCAFPAQPMSTHRTVKAQTQWSVTKWTHFKSNKLFNRQHGTSASIQQRRAAVIFAMKAQKQHNNKLRIATNDQRRDESNTTCQNKFRTLQKSPNTTFHWGKTEAARGWWGAWQSLPSTTIATECVTVASGGRSFKILKNTSALQTNLPQLYLQRH